MDDHYRQEKDSSMREDHHDLRNKSGDLKRPPSDEQVRDTLARMIREEVAKQIEVAVTEKLTRISPKSTIDGPSFSGHHPDVTDPRVKTALETWFGKGSLTVDNPNYNANMHKMATVLNEFRRSLG